MRRILIIIAILLIVIALGIVAYLFFFSKPAGETGDGSGNPFGNAGAGALNPGSIEIPEVGVPVEGAGDEVAPRLWKITADPVALGAVAFAAQTTIDTGATSSPIISNDTEIRYVDRASGNLYRFRLDARVLERLTNQTLPGIQEAAWASDGSRVFLRFLSDETGKERFETYSLPANGTDGYFLEPGLSDVIVTGTSSVTSILPSTNGLVATRSTLAGTNSSTAFSSQLSALRVIPSGLGYAAFTKPSALSQGYAFSIPRGSGELTRVMGPSFGLSVLPSPSGARFLFSQKVNNTLQLGVLDPATRGTTALPVSTMTEKCVWTHDSAAVYCAIPRITTGTLPDDWYLGAVSTSDRVWKIDLATRVASLVFDPTQLASVDIDMTALTLDDQDDVLVFTNKKDSSLWLYDL